MLSFVCVCVCVCVYLNYVPISLLSIFFSSTYLFFVFDTYTRSHGRLFDQLVINIDGFQMNSQLMYLI